MVKVNSIILHCCFAMSLCIHQQSSFATIAEDNRDNMREKLIELTNTLRTQSLPKMGKGEAIVRETRQLIRGDDLVPVVKEFYVNFSFKDQMTRAERYEYSEGVKGKCIKAFSAGHKVNAYYSGSTVVLKTEPEYYWLRAVGTDFHPDTFSLIQTGGTIADFLERTAENELLEIEERGNGLVYIAGKGVHVVLDKRIGSRLVEYRRDQGLPKINVKIAWKRYGSTWYIHKYSREERHRKHKLAASFDPPSLDIEVTKFFPNAEMTDADFEMEALNLPEGTKVHDRVTKE